MTSNLVLAQVYEEVTVEWAAIEVYEEVTVEWLARGAAATVARPRFLWRPTRTYRTLFKVISGEYFFSQLR